MVLGTKVAHAAAEAAEHGAEAASHGGIHVVLKAEEVFSLAGFPITNSLIMTVITTLVLLAFAYAVRRKLALIPGKLGLSMRGGLYKSDESSPEWESLPLPDGTLWDRSLGFGAGGKEVASKNWNAGTRLSFTPNENHDFMQIGRASCRERV